MEHEPQRVTPKWDVYAAHSEAKTRDWIREAKTRDWIQEKTSTAAAWGPVVRTGAQVPHARGRLFDGDRKEGTCSARRASPSISRRTHSPSRTRRRGPTTRANRRRRSKSQCRRRDQGSRKLKTLCEAENVAYAQWAALGKKEKSGWPQEKKKKKLDAHRKTLREWKKQIGRLRRIAAGVETEPNAGGEDAGAEDAEDADAADLCQIRQLMTF